MNTQIKNGLIFLVISLIFFFTSCRSDKEEFVNIPENQDLKSNSKVADLIRKTTMNDGSKDNILDNSSCFTIKLPLTIIINNQETEIQSVEDLKVIEEIFDEFDNDQDEIDFNFPVTVIFSDFSETIVEDDSQLEELAENCQDDDDEDIECIDFVYPITVSVFDSESEVIGNFTFNKDQDFFDFIDNLEENVIANLNFPITVILSDGIEISINDLEELKDIIEDVKDDCDEDDLIQ